MKHTILQLCIKWGTRGAYKKLIQLDSVHSKIGINFFCIDSATKLHQTQRKVEARPVRAKASK